MSTPTGYGSHHSRPMSENARGKFHFKVYEDHGGGIYSLVPSPGLDPETGRPIWIMGEGQPDRPQWGDEMDALLREGYHIPSNSPWQGGHLVDPNRHEGLRNHLMRPLTLDEYYRSGLVAPPPGADAHPYDWVARQVYADWLDENHPEPIERGYGQTHGMDQRAIAEHIRLHPDVFVVPPAPAAELPGPDTVNPNNPAVQDEARRSRGYSRTDYADPHTLAELRRQLLLPEMNAHRWGHDDPLSGLRGILADALEEVDPAQAALLREPGRHVIADASGIYPGRFSSMEVMRRLYAVSHAASEAGLTDGPNALAENFEWHDPNVNDLPTDHGIPPGNVRIFGGWNEGGRYTDHVPHRILPTWLADQAEDELMGGAGAFNDYAGPPLDVLQALQDLRNSPFEEIVDAPPGLPSTLDPDQTDEFGRPYARTAYQDPPEIPRWDWQQSGIIDAARSGVDRPGYEDQMPEYADQQGYQDRTDRPWVQDEYTQAGYSSEALMTPYDCGGLLDRLNALRAGQVQCEMGAEPEMYDDAYDEDQYSPEDLARMRAAEQSRDKSQDRQRQQQAADANEVKGRRERRQLPPGQYAMYQDQYHLQTPTTPYVTPDESHWHDYSDARRYARSGEPVNAMEPDARPLGTAQTTAGAVPDARYRGSAEPVSYAPRHIPPPQRPIRGVKAGPPKPTTVDRLRLSVAKRRAMVDQVHPQPIIPPLRPQHYRADYATPPEGFIARGRPQPVRDTELLGDAQPWPTRRETVSGGAPWADNAARDLAAFAEAIGEPPDPTVAGVFADYLQDLGDPRADEYRAMFNAAFNPSALESHQPPPAPHNPFAALPPEVSMGDYLAGDLPTGAYLPHFQDQVEAQEEFHSGGGRRYEDDQYPTEYDVTPDYGPQFGLAADPHAQMRRPTMYPPPYLTGTGAVEMGPAALRSDYTDDNGPAHHQGPHRRPFASRPFTWALGSNWGDRTHNAPKTDRSAADDDTGDEQHHRRPSAEGEHYVAYDDDGGDYGGDYGQGAYQDGYGEIPDRDYWRNRTAYADRESLEAGIAAEPWDATRHGVLADWHQEFGNQNEADFRRATMQWLPERLGANPPFSTMGGGGVILGPYGDQPFTQNTWEPHGGTGLIRLRTLLPEFRRNRQDASWHDFAGPQIAPNAEQAAGHFGIEPDAAQDFIERQAAGLPWNRRDMFDRSQDVLHQGRRLTPAEALYVGIVPNLNDPGEQRLDQNTDPSIWPQLEAILRERHRLGQRFAGDRTPTPYGQAYTMSPYMDEGEALLRGVHRDPYDTTGHLVLADWLAEQGRTDDEGFRRALAPWIKDRLAAPAAEFPGNWMDQGDRRGNDRYRIETARRVGSGPDGPYYTGHLFEPLSFPQIGSGGARRTRPSWDMPMGGFTPTRQQAEQLPDDQEFWASRTTPRGASYLTPPELAMTGIDQLANVDPAIWPQVEAMLRDRHDRGVRMEDDEQPAMYDGEEEAFRQGLRAEPDDNLTWAVYADWLDEQGRPKEAARARWWSQVRDRLHTPTFDPQVGQGHEDWLRRFLEVGWQRGQLNPQDPATRSAVESAHHAAQLHAAGLISDSALAEAEAEIERIHTGHHAEENDNEENHQHIHDASNTVRPRVRRVGSPFEWNLTVPKEVAEEYPIPSSRYSLNYGTEYNSFHSADEFEAAIDADPSNSLNRLAFSDWLQENNADPDEIAFQRAMAEWMPRGVHEQFTESQLPWDHARNGPGEARRHWLVEEGREGPGGFPIGPALLPEGISELGNDVFAPEYRNDPNAPWTWFYGSHSWPNYRAMENALRHAHREHRMTQALTDATEASFPGFNDTLADLPELPEQFAWYSLNYGEDEDYDAFVSGIQAEPRDVTGHRVFADFLGGAETPWMRNEEAQRRAIADWVEQRLPQPGFDINGVRTQLSQPGRQGDERYRIKTWDENSSPGGVPHRTGEQHVHSFEPYWYPGRSNPMWDHVGTRHIGPADWGYLPHFLESGLYAPHDDENRFRDANFWSHRALGGTEYPHAHGGREVNPAERLLTGVNALGNFDAADPANAGLWQQVEHLLNSRHRRGLRLANDEQPVEYAAGDGWPVPQHGPKNKITPTKPFAHRPPAPKTVPAEEFFGSDDADDDYLFDLGNDTDEFPTNEPTTPEHHPPAPPPRAPRPSPRAPRPSAGPPSQQPSGTAQAGPDSITASTGLVPSPHDHLPHWSDDGYHPSWRPKTQPPPHQRPQMTDNQFMTQLLQSGLPASGPMWNEAQARQGRYERAAAPVLYGLDDQHAAFHHAVNELGDRDAARIYADWLEENDPQALADPAMLDVLRHHPNPLWIARHPETGRVHTGPHHTWDDLRALNGEEYRWVQPAWPQPGGHHMGFFPAFVDGDFAEQMPEGNPFSGPEGTHFITNSDLGQGYPEYSIWHMNPDTNGIEHMRRSTDLEWAQDHARDLALGAFEDGITDGYGR